MSAYWPSLLGGLLLGLAATLLLLLNGRIAGISGILGRCLGGERRPEILLFVAALLAGMLLHDRAVGGNGECPAPPRGPRKRCFVRKGASDVFGARAPALAVSAHDR